MTTNSYIDENENKVIQEKMDALGITSLSHYLRKMATEGPMLTFDMSPLDEVAYQLLKIGNNVNEIAKRVNGTNNFDCSDVEYLKNKTEEIRELILKIYDDYKLLE